MILNGKQKRAYLSNFSIFKSVELEEIGVWGGTFVHFQPMEGLTQTFLVDSSVESGKNRLVWCFFGGEMNDPKTKHQVIKYIYIGEV